MRLLTMSSDAGRNSYTITPVVTFPVTRKSAIQAMRSPDSADRQWAISRIADAYWKPIHKYICLKWNAVEQDAEDLTQSFFAAACERSFFSGYDPSRARFRTYLRVCIDRFVLNEQKFISRLKRGGDSEHVPIEFEIVDENDYFEGECLRSIFNIATETLQRECQSLGKTTHFQLFEHCDLDETPSTYGQLAMQFGLSVTDVTNYLSWTRRRFRQIVRQLREQMEPR